MKTEPDRQALKSSLRKRMRQQRAALEHGRRQDLDRRINRHLVALASQPDIDVVTAFMAFDGEPDLLPGLEHLQGIGKTVGLPVILDRPGRAVITFRQWLPDCPLEANRYGILEPTDTAEIRVPEIDLALIPLVAWDPSGGRLGMGASFYDRLFQPYAGMSRPQRVGVAYGLQRTDSVPAEPWDIRMHGILTEDGFESCAGADH
jgi:5-formyltetrahydrofolate cyclo-ligase